MQNRSSTLVACPIADDYSITKEPLLLHSTANSNDSSSSSLIAPDFSSTSSFPQRSFLKSSNGHQEHNKHERCNSVHTRKLVRFASASGLETFYIIQNRHGLQDISIVDEELLNQIRWVRDEIVRACDEMDEKDLLELDLEDSVYELKLQCKDVSGIIHIKKMISALTARSRHLQQDITKLRMRTLRRKGQTHQFERQFQERHTIQSNLKTMPSSGNNTTLSIARAFWTKATEGRRTAGNERLVKCSAKCA